MNKRLLVYMSLFTVFVCCVFVTYNPNIADDFTSDFAEGEVIMPENGHFDFKDFSINSSKAKRFTAKAKTIGHTQFIDESGNITINYLELDKMIQSNKDWHRSLLDSELERPSWTVDGVSVHEIDFIFHDELYSAYQKNSRTNAIIYLSTPDEQETAYMMNSLTFNEE
jgi:hypothetical protein